MGNELPGIKCCPERYISGGVAVRGIPIRHPSSGCPMAARHLTAFPARTESEVFHIGNP